MPLSCAAARPSAISAPICTTFRVGSAPRPSARAQRLAVEQLHHGVGERRPAGRNRGWRGCSGARARRPRWASRSKRARAVVVRGEPARQDLDRHVAVERGVARAVDLAHAAGAERRDDLVLAESCAGCHQRLRSESRATASGSTLRATSGRSRVPRARWDSPMAPARGVPITSYTPRRVPGARVIRSANYSRAVEYRVPSPIHDRRRSIGSAGEVRVPGRTTRV